MILYEPLLSSIDCEIKIKVLTRFRLYISLVIDDSYLGVSVVAVLRVLFGQQLALPNLQDLVV